MRSIAQVEIKKPCHENWEAMTLNEKGRFCNSCQTTVINFTTKTPEEIVSILSATSSQHTCGHFNRWDVKTDNKIDNLIWKLNAFGVKRLSLFVFGILVLIGCKTKKQTTTMGSPRFMDKANPKIENFK